MAESKVEIIPNTAIGIDLGTTFARVAVWQNGKVTVIANERGNKMTPNYVGFSSTTRMVGESAKKQVSVNYKNTILAGKRLLGCSFSDKKVQESLDYQPFQVVSQDGGQAALEVQFNGGPKKFASEEISAMMLIKMKEIAEVYLGAEVKDAVITVPSCFNQCQRQATLNAGTIAGLQVLRILNEPTAAALAYELDKDFIDVETKKNVLFFCMGGGSTSVSVISIDNGSTFGVKATAGDTHLGGEDFDNKLVTYCMNEFKKKHMKDLVLGSKAIFRLKIACEKAKKSLSSCNETSIVVDSLHEDIDFVMDLTRARFEEICFDLFQSALKCVENVLIDSKLKKTAIYDVVFVGGCTKIPKIQLLLQDFFNVKEFSKLPVNMDESVVFGAAVQAAVLGGSTEPAIPNVDVVDVTPFSLAVTNLTGVPRTIIPRNSKIPFSVTQGCSTNCTNQLVELRIAELMLKDMKTVGIFRTEVTPAPSGVSRALCAFSLDANGVLHTFRIINDTNNREEIVNIIPGNHLSQEEIVRMTAEARSYKVKEVRDKELTVLRNQLEAYITSVKQTLDEASSKAAAKYAEVVSLLDDHKLTDKSLVLLKHSDIRNELMPLLKKSNACFAAGEVLGQMPDTRKNPQPDSTQSNGEPSAKKPRRNTRL